MKYIFHVSAFLLCLSLITAQDNTTTDVVTTITPTTAPASTTSVPVTTSVPPPPMPTDGFWNVTEGNITCIRAMLKIRFKIPVQNETEYKLLYPNATVTGSNCNVANNTQVLQLNNEDFVLAFFFEKESGKSIIKNVSLTVSSPRGQEIFSNSTALFSVKEGHSYLCRSIEAVPLNNATMEIFDIHIQAFGGTEDDFYVAEECEADDNVSDIVPIAVACALAGLIIIVLIAYLVGRRRSRQKGYNSV